MHATSRISLTAASVIGFLFSGCSDKPGASPRADQNTPAADNSRPVVVIQTSMGTITAELWPDASPLTVANFLRYVEKGFYDQTIFHRVIPDFMIQCGGMTESMSEKPTDRPIANEARADVKNLRGTLAMARTNNPHSATSQFFINHKDNAFLDHKNDMPEGFGYCVFGKVTDGMAVVDKIAAVKTKTAGPHENVPAEAVIIESITLLAK